MKIMGICLLYSLQYFVRITSIKNIFVKLLCVPERKGTRNQHLYVIMYPPYLQFHFDTIFLLP